ncbi:MAG TPA: ankyrin repeat domain-containing protein [Terriglobales bacterium]|nr:ankyrin repeat domain-containing protein [Terriglobales bacterium]
MAKTPEAVRMLVCASAMGDLSTVRVILRNSPDAARDWRPIMDASYKGFGQVVEVLIKHGADVNAMSSSEQNRPLHRAVEQGHHEVIEVLIRSGAGRRGSGHMAPDNAIGEGCILRAPAGR